MVCNNERQTFWLLYRNPKTRICYVYDFHLYKNSRRQTFVLA